MYKAIGIFTICATLALSGCAGSREPAGSGAAQTPEVPPEVAVVQFDAAQKPDASAPDAPALPDAAKAAEVTFTPVDAGAQATDDKTLVTVTGGCVEITVSGGAYRRDIEAAEGASVRLMLRDGAAFTGTVDGASMQDVYVSLDASSTWTLTGDVAVGAIVNADTAFANVQSGGFSMRYNSESVDNAYLSSAAIQLPGGGFLTPVI